MSAYNSGSPLENKRLTIGEAVIWNSRRIEKLEENSKRQFSNHIDQSTQKQLSLLEEKYNQLNTLVANVERRIEELNQVSLEVEESDD